MADQAHLALLREGVEAWNEARPDAPDLTGADLTGANLHRADLTGVIWSNTTCPDGTNSNNDGGTCAKNE